LWNIIVGGRCCNKHVKVSTQNAFEELRLFKGFLAKHLIENLFQMEDVKPLIGMLTMFMF
jgi:hypothetical protein